jgi:hypothetical protein
MGPLLLTRMLGLNDTQAGVLNLVFKIADDNDLDQARRALKTTLDFFGKLQEASAAASLTPWQLLQSRAD